MLDFLADIVGFLETVWQFLESFFHSLITALNVLATSITFPLSLVTYLPVIIGTSVTIIVSISVVKFILGR